MNRDDIIRMARESRMPYFYGTWEIANLDSLERFAALVVAHERENSTPPQRPWVGLTKEEAKEISLANRPYVIDMIAALEARLKEKNT
jgi:hypothetical protein